MAPLCETGNMQNICKPDQADTLIHITGFLFSPRTKSKAADDRYPFSVVSLRRR
jgi:hypothetical protein